MDIQKNLEAITAYVNKLDDSALQAIFTQLLNVIELQASRIKALEEENQMLRDENNRLKGEQGQPNLRKQSTANKDISSEKKRANRDKNKLKKKKKAKKKTLIIHKIERLSVDKATLPEDAVFKGFHSTLSQDIRVSPYNIQFSREVYYSPSLKKSIIAPLPAGYEGDFAPGLKALIIDLHHKEEMTESAIHRFLTTHDIDISTATISRILIQKHASFHQEKNDIVSAGLQSTDYQQMDDTGWRVKGINHYMHILCNQYYTAYFTKKDKTRLTIIDILSQGEMLFHFNESTHVLMEQMGMSEKMLTALKSAQPQQVMMRHEVDTFLNGLLPFASKQHTNRQIILEASAIVGYQSRADAVKILLTDDAPQFKQITELLALCWVHDGRHYKKLSPVVALHRHLLAIFLTKYWDYYHELLQYKESPSPALAEILSSQFDSLFSTVTGYDQLDARIQKTKNKKACLLLALAYPNLPLHNNTSELAARKQARYRDISFQTINPEGTQANDTFKTIIQTAKKLGVNSYHYLRERLSKSLQMPTLAQMILAGIASGP